MWRMPLLIQVNATPQNVMVRVLGDLLSNVPPYVHSGSKRRLDRLAITSARSPSNGPPRTASPWCLEQTRPAIRSFRGASNVDGLMVIFRNT
jgi:hypothetical protein